MSRYRLTDFGALDPCYDPTDTFQQTAMDRASNAWRPATPSERERMLRALREPITFCSRCGRPDSHDIPSAPTCRCHTPQVHD